MITRRDVLYAGAALLLLPSKGNAAYAVPVKVLEEPFQTLAVLHRDLFPGSGTVPSPHFLNALDYLGGVFRDPYVDAEQKAFLKNGAGWFNEQARNDFGKAYYHLGDADRQKVIRAVSQETWGANWLWTVFSYLFEALLCDPVYGANTEEAGWHWLAYIPGYPRPSRPLI